MTKYDIDDIEFIVPDVQNAPVVRPTDHGKEMPLTHPQMTIAGVRHYLTLIDMDSGKTKQGCAFTYTIMKGLPDEGEDEASAGELYILTMHVFYRKFVLNVRGEFTAGSKEKCDEASPEHPLATAKQFAKGIIENN